MLKDLLVLSGAREGDVGQALLAEDSSEALDITSTLANSFSRIVII